MVIASKVILLWWGMADSQTDAENGALDDAIVLGAYADQSTSDAELARLELTSQGGHLVAIEYVIDQVYWADGFVTESSE